MSLKLLTLFSGLVLLSLTAGANERTVYGLSETALIKDLELEVPAKLDTGAVTSSLSAQNVEMFKRDGQDWVRFELAVEGAQEGKTLVKPVVRVSQIKRRADDIPDEDSKTYTVRPVIEMAVCMGDSLQHIEVNLADRTGFEYPFLMGATALREFNALVAPDLSYQAGSPNCA
ncbi:ATP-dependent zinc protease [Halopseudomonas phragmitis]|uniref:Retropepsin-like aspartic endopeptidase domain-containing protein n=2 Tax=Pseudomonadaceae TaxID=135621 RepID=A0A1V0B2Q5_9GAMM|nr:MULTISPECIES: ATP-dependent zinc protease [Pseudomonadaceae]AQZ94223.1 hypothetical protein BVH74_05405 [Halopseudomonas phragmitis]RHW20674.1 hypothetical protein C2846_11710 [Pseudomonas jilinensis]